MGFDSGDLNPLTWPGQVKRRLGDDFGSLGGAGTDPSAGWMQSQNVQGALGTIVPGQQGAQQRQGAQIDPAFRNAQLGQMAQLQGIASGQQQGAGELAAQRQVQNALAAQQAQARMARGPSAGLAMRGAANQSAAVGLSGVGMGQQAALQDQTMAQGLMAQVGAQGRAGDLGVGQLQQQQMSANDQYQLGLLSQQTGLSIAELQARAAFEAAKAAKGGMGGQLLAAGGAIGAGAAMHSDERLKKDISDGHDDIDAMLDALRPKRYTYKDEARDGKGSRVGVMAQDMERSRAGRDVVRELPTGKALDVNAALSAALASSARLNERLRKLEKKSA